jgi:hypothetical protein
VKILLDVSTAELTLDEPFGETPIVLVLEAAIDRLLAPMLLLAEALKAARERIARKRSAIAGTVGRIRRRVCVAVALGKSRRSSRGLRWQRGWRGSAKGVDSLRTELLLSLRPQCRLLLVLLRTHSLGLSTPASFKMAVVLHIDGVVQAGLRMR